MSDMKCPFCQRGLQPVSIFDNKDKRCVWYCPNCATNKRLWVMANERVWQELIRTRKALDIRKKQVEIANKAFDFINTEWDNVDCSRKELGACAFNAKEDIAGWESDIETALEQKDVK